jgi:hypothetical protein
MSGTTKGAFFYGKLAVLLNFRNEFITNDGPNNIWDLINPHSASLELCCLAEECTATLMKERNIRGSIHLLLDVENHHSRG